MAQKMNTHHYTSLFKPNDIVKTCKYLEKGLCFQLDGLQCCVHGSKASPCIVSTEEIKNGRCTYDLIVQRKKELFLGINGRKEMDLGGCKGCTNIIEKKFKEVSFDTLGGEYLPGGFNIQHYTACNERCLYCLYAQQNDFQAPRYNILPIWEMFRQKGKLKGHNWIDFSGGEPAILKNLDDILTYLLKHKLGTVVIYSNATIFSPLIYEGLKKNKFILTTSLDTGLKSTYAKLRGADLFDRVIDNLTKYRNSGTKGLWLKYVVTEHNRTEDDLWSFLSAMLALRPNKVLLSPDFPYGDKQIPPQTVQFIAKLWYLVEKYMGDIVIDYTAVMGDPKFAAYHRNLQEEINRLKTQNPLRPEMQLKNFKSAPGMLVLLLKKTNKRLPSTPLLNKIRTFVRNILVSWGIY